MMTLSDPQCMWWLWQPRNIIAFLFEFIAFSSLLLLELLTDMQRICGTTTSRMEERSQNESLFKKDEKDPLHSHSKLFSNCTTKAIFFPRVFTHFTFWRFGWRWWWLWNNIPKGWRERGKCPPEIDMLLTVCRRFVPCWATFRCQKHICHISNSRNRYATVVC